MVQGWLTLKISSLRTQEKLLDTSKGPITTVLFALIRKPCKPIEEKFSKTFEENQNNLVYQVWSNLIPWHQDVTNAWKKGDEKANLPRLNVNALTSINVDIDPAVYNKAGFQIIGRLRGVLIG